jgi:hypothetical protein
MRTINRFVLFAIYALHQFTGTGRPNVFAGRKVLRAARSWWRHAKQEGCALAEQFRDWLADGLIRLAERLVPLPQAVPVLAFESATPYGCLPEPERVPAPSFNPVPSSVWDEVENAQEVKTLTAEEGLKKMDEIMAARPAKKARKARAAAHTVAKPKAKRTPTARPAAKKDPLREAKYEEVRFQMACGKSQKAACKEVGVPESSFRTWAKKNVK